MFSSKFLVPLVALLSAMPLTLGSPAPPTSNVARQTGVCQFCGTFNGLPAIYDSRYPSSIAMEAFQSKFVSPQRLVRVISPICFVHERRWAETDEHSHLGRQAVKS
ncbi:hypothetical protein N431DRAFT_556388 [Stipitochalara longipes BDJ]|nr:hypothetical protein N431DRAFT_556388 [Stipitochalara longipes BDJ]